MPRIYENKANYYHYPKAPSKKKNEWGEYNVPAYDAVGKRVKDKDYNTDDYDDAVATHSRLLGKKYDGKTGKEI